MTANEFAAICIERAIDPALALVSEAVRSAIANGPDAVRSALDQEF